MTVGENIRRTRKDRGFTAQELSERVGVSRQTVTRYETGEIKVSLEMVQKIAGVLGVLPTDLLGIPRDEASENAVPVPTLGEVAGGPPIDALEDAYEEFSISRALAESGTFATFKIRGDSMAPRINDGDVVLVEYGADVRSGDIAVVMMGDPSMPQVTCKKVFYLDGGKVKLQAFNEEVYSTKIFTRYELQEMNFRILGRVLMAVRSFT